MPKFYRTVLFTSLLLWLGVIYVLFKVAPNSFSNIFLFLFLIFLAIALTFSLIWFKFNHGKHLKYSPRLLFRRGLRWGGFVAFVITGTLGFKAFGLINPLNYGMFSLICFGMYFWLRRFR